MCVFVYMCVCMDIILCICVYVCMDIILCICVCICVYVTRFSKRSHVVGGKNYFFVSFCSTYFEESFDILALG